MQEDAEKKAAAAVEEGSLCRQGVTKEVVAEKTTTEVVAARQPTKDALSCKFFLLLLLFCNL